MMNYSKLPKTRQEAARRGIYKYFTGKPCIHGHISARYVVNAACVTCCIESATAGAKRTRKLLRENKKAEFLTLMRQALHLGNGKTQGA